jgi:hypothetical protein
VPAGDGYGGRRAQTWVAQVLDSYGLRCHLCSCDPDQAPADSADHLQTRQDRPDLMYVVSNGRPVHHRRCAVCGQACNIARRAKRLTSTQPVDALPFFEAGP